MADANTGSKRLVLKVKNKEDLKKRLECLVNDEGKQALMGHIEHLVCEEGKVVQWELSRKTNKQQKPASDSSEDEGMDPCEGGPKIMLNKFSYCEFLTTKDCKKTTFEEFITAAHKWGANANEATADDLRGYLAHLGFISSKATSRQYDHQVHIDYDKAIRIQAEEIGWAAFKADNTTVANLYYDTLKNMPNNNVDQREADVDQCSVEDTVDFDDHQHSEETNNQTLALKKEAGVRILEKKTVWQSFATVATDPDQTVTESVQELPVLTPVVENKRTKKQKAKKKGSKLPEGLVPSDSLICYFCGKQCTCPSKLKVHLKSHQSSDREPRFKKHLCSDCGKRFETRSSLENHVRKHTGERPFSCTECDKKFISAETLKLHSNIHTGKKRFICSHCGKQFLSSGSLTMHNRMHTGEKPHLCSYCGKGFRGSGGLRNHIRSHTGEKPHKCSECGKGFSSTTNLARHLLLHTGENPFKCPYCSKTCKQRANLNVHIKARHSEGKQPRAKKTGDKGDHSGDSCMCSYCGKLFNKLSALKIHMTIHTGRPHSCTECGKGFATASSLNIHTRIHTGEKPYSCAHCDKRFATASGLDTHTMNHTGKKPHPCTYCGKGFRSSAALESHTRIHTGEKPFVCSVCGKAFTTHTNLTKHKLIHTGEKPFVCTYCGKGFSQKVNQQLHEKIHTGEKPFVCSECGKGFSRAADLRKHMKVHGGLIVTPQTVEVSAVDLLADYQAPLHI